MNAVDWRLASLLLALMPWSTEAAQESSKDGGVLVCESLHAKQSLADIKTEVKATKFTAPNGDGRRGAAGLLIQTKDRPGTRIAFTFRRSPTGYGFQVIHPLGKGHVLVSIDSDAVRLYRGGSWANIGWGNPETSERVTKTEKAREILPLQPEKDYDVTSELGSSGKYRLWMNGILMCEHQVKDGSPLVLEMKDRPFWGGPEAEALYGRFEGPDFESKLREGQAGVIVGPTDQSGEKQRMDKIKIATGF